MWQVSNGRLWLITLDGVSNLSLGGAAGGSGGSGGAEELDRMQEQE